jgi:hypothetical protein
MVVDPKFRGEITETSGQQSGIFSYRNFEFYQNLRNSYLRSIGRKKIYCVDFRSYGQNIVCQKPFDLVKECLDKTVKFPVESI